MIRVIFAPLLLLASGATQTPTLAEQLHQCQQSWGQQGAPRRIAACTAIIASSEEDEPTHVDALIGRASGYMGVGDVPRAISDYNEAIRRGGPNAIVYWMRGAAYDHLKDYRHAISDYGLAIKVDPTDSVALTSRGKSYLQLGNVRLGLADFDRASALGNSSWACSERAKLGIELDRARTDCDAAIRQAKANPYSSKNTSPYVARCMVGMKQKRFNEAWNDCDAAVQIKPDSVTYFGRGLAALALARATEGQADIAKAVQLDPKIAEYYAGFGLSPR